MNRFLAWPSGHAAKTLPVIPTTPIIRPIASECGIGMRSNIAEPEPKTHGNVHSGHSHSPIVAEHSVFGPVPGPDSESPATIKRTLARESIEAFGTTTALKVGSRPASNSVDNNGGVMDP